MAPMNTEPIFGIAVKHAVVNDNAHSIMPSTTSSIKKSKTIDPNNFINDII